MACAELGVGEHSVKLVVTGKNKFMASGACIYLNDAVVHTSSDKISILQICDLESVPFTIFILEMVA